MRVNEEPNVFIVILTSIDVISQMVMSVTLPSNSVNRYGLTELKLFIFGMGRTYAFIQSDDESSIKAWINASGKEVLGLRMRKASTGSHGSQGSVDRQLQTLFGAVRTTRLALIERLGDSLDFIDVKHPICPWIIKHSQWLLSICVIHTDGVTAYQR